MSLIKINAPEPIGTKDLAEMNEESTENEEGSLFRKPGC